MGLKESLRNWFTKIVVDATDARFDEVCKEILLVEKMIDEVKVKLSDSEARLSAASIPASVPEAEPLRATRPSWPRMKRLLEERDVRAGLASQEMSSNAAINRTFNNEADRVETYWKTKQQKEN